MTRLLLILLALTASLHALEAPLPPPPPPQDFLDHPIWAVGILLVVSTLLTVVMVPLVLLGWAVFVFLIVLLLKAIGITPQMLLMKLVQRQMMGKNKGILGVLAGLICLPAGLAGLWIGTMIFGVPAKSTSLLVVGSACGLVVAFGLVRLAKVMARRMQQRMMGGMQAQMMADMLKMRGGE